MARQYKYSLARRVINRFLIWMLKVGFAPKSYYLLTVNGRITGNPHSVPVALVEDGANRWLVAPYGEVDWVKNARAAQRVRLSRGKTVEGFGLREMPTDPSKAVLKQYLKSYPITKSYFNAQEDSELNEFEMDAKNKPVFELIREDRI